MATLESRIDKINKLLAQAADPAATVKEAERFAKHAAKLMARHEIDQAMLDAQRGIKTSVTERLVPVDEPFSREKAVLTARIAAALHCRTVHLRNRATGNFSGSLVMGAPGDLDRVLTLHSLLWTQAWRGVMSDPMLPWGTSAEVKRYQRNWLHSFATAVGARLAQIEDHAIAEDQAERTAAKETGPSTALVVTGREVAVNAYYDERYGQAVEDDYTAPDVFDQGALNGLLAGHRADIGLRKVEGS